MANFTKGLSAKIEGKNGLAELEVKTTIGVSFYEAVKTVLTAGKVACVSALDRKGVPLDEQVRGNGTTASYKKGNIFLERENQGTPCISGLIPKDSDAQATLRTALAGVMIGGEKPTNVTFQLWG